MKRIKITSTKLSLKLVAKKEGNSEPVDELVYPRILVNTAAISGSKKASNSLMLQMYSRENEVLFI
jgi:hypothetical protein